ncbi:hypothetical protein ACFQ80_10885 [Isoptericola sp. NPDC056578]|uniref:hypothetical protein n=1 Tax=Isoptericola sp. NPDC056578 TaxID=3345870 RepID=UPI003688793F
MTTTTDTTRPDAQTPAQDSPQRPQDAPETRGADQGTDDATDAQNRPDDPEPDQGDGRPDREAARYRTRLRAAEAERDQLAERVTAMQRAEVERIAGERIVSGSAIWAAGTTLDDVLDDDGQVDPEKVADAVKQAQADLGLARRPRVPRSDPSQGVDATVAEKEPFAKAFAPRDASGRIS